MTPGSRPEQATSALALVVADVDGTLVTPEKVLPPSAVAAAGRLAQAGVRFTLISSRPPRGMKAVLQSLGVTLPFAAFNGGSLIGADGRLLRAHRLDPQAAREALELLAEHGVDAWVYAGDDWRLRDPKGPRVDLENRTIGYGPTVVADFADVIDRIDKIVGVSLDAPLLAQVEAEARRRLGVAAAVNLSQPYYLDITHPMANKGDGMTGLCSLMGVDPVHTAVIGDMFNDTAMFARAGFSVAMGQSPEPVKALASAVTLSNRDDGFAHAVERFFLPRAGAGDAPWR